MSRTLAGKTVVVLGGTAGIGLETARLARTDGADLIVTARNPDRLREVGRELGAKIEAFDVRDFDRLQRFFEELPRPVDHVLVTGPGPYYALLQDFDFDEARRDIDAHLLLPMQGGKLAGGRVRGRLLFRGGPGGRRTGPGLSLIGALTAAMPALTRNL